MYKKTCFYHNESNYSIIQAPPLFQEKWLIVFQAFEHPCLKSISEHLTLQSSNGGHKTSTSLRQFLWSSKTRGAKCELAFNSLCRARTEVAGKRVIVFGTLCQAWTGVRECLLAFNSLWTSLVIVTSNVYSVFVWIVLLSWRTVVCHM